MMFIENKICQLYGCDVIVRVAVTEEFKNIQGKFLITLLNQDFV